MEEKTKELVKGLALGVLFGFFLGFFLASYAWQIPVFHFVFTSILVVLGLAFLYVWKEEMSYGGGQK